MTLRRLVLWRHGETDHNASRRMQGQLDSVLTALGEAQARRAAPLLAAMRPDLLLSSDLGRATATMAPLAECTGLLVRTDERLRETHLGQWQGLTHDDVDERWPGARQAWRLDAGWSPPGGENRLQVAARAGAVVAELDATDATDVIVCTHGGLIASLVASLLALPVDNWPALGGIANCCWVVLERPEPSAPDLDATADVPSGPGVTGWRLRSYNAGPHP
ncbi:MAG TPA: histidine phosphatase family protein [Pseudonocardiaceae bacterium]